MKGVELQPIEFRASVLIQNSGTEVGELEELTAATASNPGVLHYSTRRFSRRVMRHKNEDKYNHTP